MRFTFALAVIAALTFGVASLAQADHRGPGPCTDLEDAARTIGMWGEKLVAEKDGKRLYVNPNDGAWSILSWDVKTDTACLLKEGQKPAPSEF